MQAIDLTTGEIIHQLPISCRGCDGGISRDPELVVGELLRQRNHHENVWYRGRGIYLHEVFSLEGEKRRENSFQFVDHRYITKKPADNFSYFMSKNMLDIDQCAFTDMQKPNSELKFGWTLAEKVAERLWTNWSCESFIDLRFLYKPFCGKF